MREIWSDRAMGITTSGLRWRRQVFLMDNDKLYRHLEIDVPAAGHPLDLMKLLAEAWWAKGAKGVQVNFERPAGEN